MRHDLGDVLVWQLFDNLAGLVTVLSLTGLLRHMPLTVAFPVTTGISIPGVQVVATKCLFHESITPLRWMGAVLIGVGVFLVQRP
jgi:multidrug transporter EmrE-like cation transporter